MKKMFLLAFVAMVAMGAYAQMNVWENGGLAAQYAVENVDSVTFGITSATPESGTGKDGITPLLKIENDYWFISYDEGVTWQQEGKAKGEKGDKGDSMFQAVTQDSNFVYLTLLDSSVIKIAKVKEDENNQPHGDDYIVFQDSYTKVLLLSKGIDTNDDGEISYNEAASVSELIISDENLRSFKEFQYFTGVTNFSFSSSKKLFEIILPKTIKTIPEKAFYYTAVYNISIPNGCTIIQNQAFYCASNLRNITIPNTITYFGTQAFYNTKLKEFIFPENYGGEYEIFGTYSSATVPPKIIWNTIYYIANYAIGGSKSYYGLGHVESGQTNTTLKEVIFGDKVRSIPAYLCYGLASLTEITLPASLEVIGNSAFRNCTMSAIYCKATTPPILGTTVFPETATIYVPNEYVEIYKTSWRDYADKIVGYNFE